MAYAPGSDFVSRDGNVTFRDTGGQFAERVDEYGHGTGTYTNVNDLIPMSWLRPPENTQSNAGAAPVVRAPVAPVAAVARPVAAPTFAPPSGGGGMAAGWRGALPTPATTPAWNTNWAMPPGNDTYSAPVQQRRAWDTDWTLPPNVPSGYTAPRLTAPTVSPWQTQQGFNTRWATPPTKNTFDVQPYQPRPTYKQPVDTGSFTISITPGEWGGR